MKTANVRERWLNALFLLSIVLVIQGCYSYRSILKSTDSQAQRQTEMTQHLIAGNSYLIILRTGGELNMLRVAAVTDLEIIGEMEARDAEGVILTDKSFGVVTIPDGRIPLSEIADIREKKFSASRTVIVAVIPAALFGIMVVASTPKNDNAGNP